MEICQKCIIPESFPGISFEEGVCSICRNHKHTPKIKKNYLGKEKLLQILTSKKGEKYDCSVPLSGGKDSSYVLYYVVKELGLKPLALFFDNGFTTEFAYKNIENICNKLNVDLIVGKATPYRANIIRETLYISKYLNRMLPLCTNCESNLRSFAINETAKRKIPFILWGSTDFEDSEKTFAVEDARTFREGYGTMESMLKKVKKALGLIFSPVSFVNKVKASYHAVRFLYYAVRDNFAINVPEGWKKINPFLEVSFAGKEVETIYFYDYIYYDPAKFIKILEQDVGWRAPQGKEEKMDCQISFWHDYEKYKETGLSATGFTLSVLVRDGLLDRNEALEKEKIIEKELKQECQKIGEKFNIDLGDLL